MDNILDMLEELSADPFTAADYSADPIRRVGETGLSVRELKLALCLPAGEVAGKEWASCDTCADPGYDGPLPSR